MTISSINRKAGPYVGNGTASVFPFAFKVFQASDLEVVRLNVATNVETILALTTDYTVALNQDQDSNPGGSITLVAGALATGFNLVITSDVENLQPTDLTNQGGFYPDVINDALDRATIQIQQLQEEVDRAAKLPITSAEDANALVADIVRLADSADNIDTVAGSIDNVNIVAADIADVSTVSANITNVNTVAGVSSNVTTVAGSIANVNTVASDLNEPVSEINTVAVNIDNVNTVGNNIANVNTVAGNNANVTTVAGISSDVTTVATNNANVTTTASNINAVNTVANDLNEPVSEIDTVATNIANINTVGTNISNVNTVAGISANVTTVAGISANVTTVATNNANVTTVATNISNVNAVAGNNTNITAVAGNATNINAVAANATNINAVNANSANINTVAAANTAINTVSTNIVAVNSAYTNIAAIIDAPNQAAAAANSAAQAAASAASGMYSAVQDKSANYTIVAGDAGDLIRVTTTSGAVTITLPTISTVGDGFKIAVVKWTSDANAVNIARSGSDTINGATSAQIGSQYSQIILVADGETSTWFASQSGLGATNVNIDNFSGNGSTTAFTLTSDPSTENNTSVFISGVYQQKNTYSVSGTTLTFSTAPPSGTGNIEVAYATPLAIGTPSDGTVTNAKIVDGAVTYAKIQNVSAGKVLGRDTSGSGVVQELPISINASGNTGIGRAAVANIKLVVEQPSGEYDVAKPIQRWAYAGVPIVDLYMDGSANPISNTDSASTYAQPNTMKWQYRGSDRMSLDSIGRLMVPYQPAFRATRTAGSMSTAQTIVFNSVGFNTGSCYSNSTGRFTAPVAGRYVFFAQLETFSATFFTFWRKNGAGVQQFECGVTSLGTTGLGSHFLIELAANDYVDLYLQSGSVYGTDNYTYMSGYLIG